MDANQQIKQGISMQRQGDLNGAMLIYQRILEGNPNHSDALHYLGLTHYQLGNWEPADKFLSRSLTINPNCANTSSDLGMVKVRCQLYRESLPFFRRALEIDSNHVDAMNNMATALKHLNLHEQARSLYERLSTLKPNSAQLRCKLADAQYQSNQVGAAISSYQKAIQIDGNHKQSRVGLGEALESNGKFKQAKMQYLTVLRRDEKSPVALARLLQLREGDVDPSNKWISKARELIESPATLPEERVRLHVALGYFYDRQKSYDKAFRHLKLGYDELSKKEPYDSQSFSKAVDKLLEVLTPAFFECAASSRILTEKPIFIVGMPRSGTTLTEQILASHSQVAAGGELPTLLHVSHQAQELAYTKSPYPYCLTDIGRIALSKLAKTYLDRLNKISGTARMVTDKMPFNFLHLAVICMLFPNAKIIHCRRHPIDNCLSCYFTSFANQIKFANSLDTLGKYYLDYHRLMDHCQRVLPIQMFDLQYEELVSDTEEKVQSLLHHCGLEWEDTCLEFYRTKRGVRTPSRWQVRQPIYSSSVQRWRNYERHLKPLKRLLTPLLPENEQ